MLPAPSRRFPLMRQHQTVASRPGHTSSCQGALFLHPGWPGVVIRNTEVVSPNAATLLAPTFTVPGCILLIRPSEFDKPPMVNGACRQVMQDRPSAGRTIASARHRHSGLVLATVAI